MRVISSSMNKTDDSIKIAAEVAANAAEVAANVARTAAEVASKISSDNAILSTNIDFIKRDIGEIKDALRGLSGQYVTRVEFEPIKRIVYGLITVLGLATMGAIFKLIFIK